MAGRVAVVVLLAVVFVGALRLSSAKDCVQPDVVVQEGEKDKIIQQKNETEPQKNMSTSLYVKPGGDFAYVKVTAEDETPGNSADKRLYVKGCNLTSGVWNLLEVKAKVVKNEHDDFEIEFSLSDGCGAPKKDDYYSGNITRLTVTASGVSEWLLCGPPDPCPDTTKENPSFASLSTSDSSASLPTPVLAVIIVVIVAAVVGGVIIWKRQRRLSAPQRVLRSIQSTSRRDTDAGYSGQVVENSLYEPLPGPVTPAARQEQPGTVQVIENSLYEPLPFPLTAATQEP